MQTLKLLCPLLLLASPLVTQEPDSPITVSDGSSIHIHRAIDSLFLNVAPKKASLQIVNKSYYLAISGCTPAANCDATLGKSKWVITVYDINGAPTTTLTHPGQGGGNYVDIEVTPMAATAGSVFSQSGIEVVQSNVHLHHITVLVNGQTKTYPASGSSCSSPCEFTLYK
jgi:hypothetical protein